MRLMRGRISSSREEGSKNLDAHARAVSKWLCRFISHWTAMFLRRFSHQFHLTIRCLKKYCSCYFNSVGCTDKCNCTQCNNSYGKRVNPKKKRANDVIHNKLLNPDIQLAVDRLNESPQKFGSNGTTIIEHYPYAVEMAPAAADDSRALMLQKQANLNSARANLLLVKQMLLSAKYKQWDLEYSYGQFQDSGVSTAQLENMMKAVREALQSATDLTKEVKSMELDIAMNYEIYSPR